MWQVTYPNSFQHKPGQVDDGTGTTPTVMPGGYVNITDNADPMDIMVYRTAAHPYRIVRHGHHRRRQALPRQVCRVPVFSRGASDDENSIIVAGRAMIAENNYGYTDPGSITGGKLTAPGFVRVDINRERPRLPQGVDEHHRARPDGRVEALARHRADLHLHQGARA